MNMKKFKALLLIFLFFLLSDSGFSQNPKPEFSFNPKAGIYLSRNNLNGGAAGVEINYLIKGWIFSFDFFQFQELNLLSSRNQDIFRQIGLMAGKYYGDRMFRIQLEGGIASVWEIGLKDFPETENFSTIGLVLKTGFKFLPLHFLSIGLDLQSNFNREKSLYMPLLSIEIGNLRSKLK